MQKVTAMRAKPVFRADEIQKHYRLFRVMWERGTPGDGTGYSVKLSVALAPRLLGWTREGRADWFLFLAGLRIHYARSYGGRFG